MTGKFTILILAMLTLNACQLNNKTTNSSSWYMRSEITWWEARPEFRLRKNEEGNLLETEFSMISDGQEYHLKITDKVLSKDKNCGAPKNANRQLPLDTWRPLSCFYSGDELTPLAMGYRFNPTKAENYVLHVKLTEGKPSAIKVSEFQEAKH